MSATVADFLGSALVTESGATYTIFLERDGDCNLLCLVRDSAVLMLRVATRLAMMEDGSQEVRATSASGSFEARSSLHIVASGAMQIQRSTSIPSNIDRPQSSLSNRALSRASVAPAIRPSSSLGISRPISRVSQRPTSRLSQRPASRQSHHPAHSQISAKVSGLIHTLVTQITGITNENDPENYKIAYDYANKHLELGMLGISGVVGLSWDMGRADAHFTGCVRASARLKSLFRFGSPGIRGRLMS